MSPFPLVQLPVNPPIIEEGKQGRQDHCTFKASRDNQSGPIDLFPVLLDSNSHICIRKLLTVPVHPESEKWLKI